MMHVAALLAAAELRQMQPLISWCWNVTHLRESTLSLCLHLSLLSSKFQGCI